MFQQSSLLQQERCRVAAGRHQATVAFKDNEACINGINS